jgi:predicted nucleic-acid-binding protein
MRAIDTNVLIRLIVRDDPKQVSAAEAFVEQGAWVSHLVMAEATWVLSAVYERDAKSLAATVDMLLNHKSITIQDADVVSDALAHFRKRPTIGFSDCMLLAIARKNGHLPLGTFDQNLSKLPDAERLPG